MSALHVFDFDDDEPPPHPGPESGMEGDEGIHQDTAPPKPLIISTAEFVTGFVAPDYLIDGMLQKRFMYSMTAPTGTGKTAIALSIAGHVDKGQALAGREIEPGKVLFFAGENPDDVRMRWIKMSEEMGIDPATSGVYWRAGGLNLSTEEIWNAIKFESSAHGPFSLIVVDTSAAFFNGNDENSNAQMGAHARMLRGFTGLAGQPAVIVTCHPTKSPNADNLLPRGGGAFIAEMDGNLVCTKQPDNSVVELHWQGKFRGPDFAPIPFCLTTGMTAALVDSKGRPIPTVTARPISELEVREAESATRIRQDSLLAAIKRSPEASLAELAKDVGWLYRNGNPNKTRVDRTMKSLTKDGLIKKDGRQWVLTNAGQKAV